MKYFASFLLMIILAAAALPAAAGQLNVPGEYGLTARGVGMGNAMTAVSDDPGLVYHNPAGMAAVSGSQYGFGYLFAKPDFQGGPKGELRDYTEPNNILLNSLVLDLSGILKSRRPFAAGLFVDFDRNGRQLMDFSDAGYEDGKFYRYGRAGTVGILSFALGITDWLNVGGGVMAMQHSFVHYNYSTDLTGVTHAEGMTREDRLNYSALLSAFLDFQHFDIGVTYRGENYRKIGDVDIDSQTLVGQAELSSFPVVMQFQDSYTPRNISVGVSFDLHEDVLVAIDGAWSNWGRFDELTADDDSPRADVEYDFVDVYSGRFGFEYSMTKNLPVRLGYGFLPTPVRKAGSDGNIYLDNDRHVFSMGLGYLFTDMPVIATPLGLDVAFMHQYLAPDKYDSADDEPIEFQSKGNLNCGVVSLTFRF